MTMRDVEQKAEAIYETVDRQKAALLDLFDALTPRQKEEIIRELEEKKQINDQLLKELLARESERKAS